MGQISQSFQSEDAEEHSQAWQLLDRLEHNFVLWAFVEAAMLLGLLFATVVATQTTPGTFFWVAWVVAVVMSVFVLPAWAIRYLGGPNDQAPELAEAHDEPAPMAER